MDDITFEMPSYVTGNEEYRPRKRKKPKKKKGKRRRSFVGGLKSDLQGFANWSRGLADNMNDNMFNGF